MNIDEKIKLELKNDNHEFDDITANKDGLFDLIFGSFKGGMGRWVIIVNFFTIVASVLMFWTGYQFFTSSVMQDHVYWGFCLIVSVVVQIALKQWFFMEINRSSLMREIKRVEVAVAKLSARMDS